MNANGNSGVARCVQEVIDECDLKLDHIKALGIGAPGAIDPEEGRMVFLSKEQYKYIRLHFGKGEGPMEIDIWWKRFTEY